jgi:hypothetical protein
MATIVKYADMTATVPGDISVDAAKAALRGHAPEIDDTVAEVYTDDSGNKVINFKMKAGKLGK